MENNKEMNENPVSPRQDDLMKKMLNCSKILDSEYQELKNILENQVKGSYTASVFIDHILSLVKFRRTFISKKHKAYKKCIWCKARERIVRVKDFKTERLFWCCYKCYLNLDPERYCLTEKYRLGDGFSKYKIKESPEHKEHFEPARNQRAEQKIKKGCGKVINVHPDKEGLGDLVYCGEEEGLCKRCKKLLSSGEEKTTLKDIYNGYKYTPEQEEADEERRAELKNEEMEEKEMMPEEYYTG